MHASPTIPHYAVAARFGDAATPSPGPAAPPPPAPPAPNQPGEPVPVREPTLPNPFPLEAPPPVVQHH